MPAPGQATPDELAALYLRGRDVACPACGYDRRDGLTAACPECAHVLLVRHGAPLESHAHALSLRRIVNLVPIAAGLTVAGDLFNLGRTIVVMVNSGIPFAPMAYSFVWLGLNLLFGVAAIVLALRASSALRHGPDLGRALRLLTLAILAALMTGILSLPVAVFYAIFY